MSHTSPGKLTLLRKKLFPETLVRSFCRANRSFWEKYLSDRPSEHNSEYILVDGFVEHTGYVMRISSAANVLKRTKGISTLWCTRNYFNRKLHAVIGSYGANAIENLAVLKFPLLAVLSVLRSIPIFISLDVRELVGLRYRDIQVGDLVYDNYLCEGHATVRGKNFHLFKKISEAVFWYHLFDLLFRKYDVKYMLLGHTVYSMFGVLARLGVQRGAVLYGVRGPKLNEISIKRVDSPGGALECPIKITKPVFDNVFENHRDIAIDEAERYMSLRVKGGESAEASQGAYGKGMDRMEREGLVSLLGLDPGKPVVFLFSHVFTDCPHYNSWYLFDDHYLMAYETIERMASIDTVNWVLKEHPFNEHPHYISGESLKSIARDIYGDTLPDNIKVLPENISTESVIYLADGIITGYGHIGLEASSFGVKSLLGGEATFSDLGFTFDPRSKDDFFDAMEKIFTKDSAYSVDVDRAKIAVFLEFKHLAVRLGIIPAMKGFTLNIGTDDELEAYSDAILLLERPDAFEDYGLERMKEFFESGAQQLTNSFEIYGHASDEQG